MNKLIVAAAALLPLAVAIPGATAQTPISVGRFDAIELRGGGDLVIRHGAQQRVTLLQGDRNLAGFDIERGRTLVIRPCRSSCRNQRLRVEVVTPRIDAIAIHGGGTIRAEGAFPAEANLAVAIGGGGTLDARAITGTNVAAAINGGGLIRTSASRSLAAVISGGGTISYRGNPEKTVAINGGGTVVPER